MGESFKLHSQALAGYEDSILAAENTNNANTTNSNSTPQPLPAAPQASEVAAY